MDELEKQRQDNLRAMERHIEEVNEYLATSYPMKPDNRCLRMTGDEFKAYIGKRRAEFEERHRVTG